MSCSFWLRSTKRQVVYLACEHTHTFWNAHEPARNGELENRKKELENSLGTAPRGTCAGVSLNPWLLPVCLVFCCGLLTFSAKPQLDKKREESLKRALLDLYRDLTLLQNFAIVNYTAVVKVCVLCDLCRSAQTVFLADEVFPVIIVEQGVCV